ncbi:hypothetical protein LTR36_004550 [Oleoguttula mirabilis]|uniref:Uncharacterized protein n=1 Tax=Oleoguttula mirabilis TaxID=1507867 RepID=A0AAV9JG02_9PEZI|nr:hypothetical protein LTR36_004550 [Oleoguttula mirabilis]
MPALPGASPKTPRSDINPAALLCVTAAMMLRTFVDQVTAYKKYRSRWQSVLGSDTLMNALLSLYTSHVFGPTLLAHIPRLLDYAEHTKKHRQRGKECEFGDTFVKGLVELCTRREELPIWLVVACQTYLDIYDIVGTNTTCGVDALADGHHTAADTSDQFRAFSNKLGGKCVTPLWNGYLEEVASHSIPFADSLAKINAAPMGSTGMYLDFFGFIPVGTTLSLPVTGCAQLYDLKIRAHVNGTLIANDGFVILALAHLYKAARMYGLVTTEWQDMEFVIAQQSSEQDFVTESSTDSDSYAMLRHYRTALGRSVTKHADHDVSELPSYESVTKSARGITVTSYLVAGMMKQTKEQAELGLFSDETIGTVLQALAKKAGSASAPTNLSGRVTPQLAKKGEKGFTPIQILAAFKQSFITDEPMLNFDYISFSHICGELVQAMQGVVLPQLSYAASTSCTRGYVMIDYLLREAADATAQSQPPSATLFAPAAAAMQELIAEHGNTFTTQARNQSSSHIPQHLRPNLTPLDPSGGVDRIRHLLGESAGLSFESARQDAAIYHPHGTLEMVAKILKAQDRLSRLEGLQEERWQRTVAVSAHGFHR